MRQYHRRATWAGWFLLVGACSLAAAEPARLIDLWPELAPGETTRSTGQTLPQRADENPPATRIRAISQPQMERFDPPAGKANGVSVLIFPGGGYNYVVIDKEGSEVAAWLNRFGVTAFVVRYRTRAESSDRNTDWLRPLQDGQRAVSLVRHHAADWGLSPERIGVIGFSAGGQLGALVATRFAQRSYAPRDDIDKASCRPDFAMLIYPWQLVDARAGKLADFVTISKDLPPAFLVHSHNDRAAPSLNSLLFYAALREQGVPAELHVYENGGHGYGMRPVADSYAHTWPQRAEEWLRHRKLIQ